MIDAARREGRISGRDRAVLHAAELSDQAFEGLASDDEQPSEPQEWVNGSAAAATLAVAHAVDFGGNAAERLERAQLKRRADTLLAKRPPPVKRLFELVYEEGLSLDAAARTCGISPSWATRIHAREIALLARALHAASEPRATPERA
jgi:DNA-directed RNA polymerase specialized sigma24 family protein